MNHIFKAIILLFMTLSLAAQEIKLTSFRRAGNNPGIYTAEVCGFVKGPSPMVYHLEVISDYRGRAPGPYTATTFSTGQFCKIIMTLRGEVLVRFSPLRHSGLEGKSTELSL